MYEFAKKRKGDQRGREGVFFLIFQNCECEGVFFLIFQNKITANNRKMFSQGRGGNFGGNALLRKGRIFLYTLLYSTYMLLQRDEIFRVGDLTDMSF